MIRSLVSEAPEWQDRTTPPLLNDVSRLKLPSPPAQCSRKLPPTLQLNMARLPHTLPTQAPVFPGPRRAWKLPPRLTLYCRTSESLLAKPTAVVRPLNMWLWLSPPSRLQVAQQGPPLPVDMRRASPSRLLFLCIYPPQLVPNYRVLMPGAPYSSGHTTDELLQLATGRPLSLPWQQPIPVLSPTHPPTRRESDTEKARRPQLAPGMT